MKKMKKKLFVLLFIFCIFFLRCEVNSKTNINGYSTLFINEVISVLNSSGGQIVNVLYLEEISFQKLDEYSINITCQLTNNGTTFTTYHITQIENKFQLIAISDDINKTKKLRFPESKDIYKLDSLLLNNYRSFKKTQRIWEEFTKFFFVTYKISMFRDSIVTKLLTNYNYVFCLQDKGEQVEIISTGHIFPEKMNYLIKRDSTIVFESFFIEDVNGNEFIFFQKYPGIIKNPKTEKMEVLKFYDRGQFNRECKYKENKSSVAFKREFKNSLYLFKKIYMK